MEELINYQYYGLVGKGVADISSSLIQGFSTAAAMEVQAGGYGMSAEMLEIQAQQETINAEAQATARMEQYNQSAAANVAIMSAMGKSAENTTIDAANYEAALRDASLMKREGKLRSISAKSGAAAQRGAAEQSKIAAETAQITGILGAVSGAAGAVGSYSMIGGGSTPKGTTAKTTGTK